MRQKIRLLSLCLINGFFLFLDRFLKWESIHNWHINLLLNNFLGWNPFLNHGIAFGIPIPNLLIIFFTIPIIIIVFYLFWKENTLLTKFALSLIFFGALSNLYDRIFYQDTIDYLLILTAVINLADIMITIGFAIYLFKNYKKIW